MSEPNTTGPSEFCPVTRGGQITVIAIGAILLLPGSCSLFVMVSMVPWDISDPFFAMTATISTICFLISAGGVAMIYAGRRRATKAD